MNYEARTMMGRLSDGFARDHGKIVHACFPGEVGTYCRGKAICGAEPGRRSAGWSQVESIPVTCLKCLKKMTGKLKRETKFQ